MLDKRVKLPIWSYRRLIAWSICAMVMPAMWTAAQAEVTEVHLAKQYGLAYLPLMIMEHQKLLEKQAKAMGLGNVTVTWNTFGGGSVMNDALLSGRLDFASGAVTSLAVLWSKTRGNVDVRGVAAMNSMPFLLNTRNPKIKTIRDFTDADKIALPAVRISPQALVLEIAAAKAFGETNYNRLDRLTVSMSHPQAMLAMLSGKGGIELAPKKRTPRSLLF